MRLLGYQEKGLRKDVMKLLFDIWKTKKSNGNPKYNDKSQKPPRTILLKCPWRFLIFRGECILLDTYVIAIFH
ncbi:MAG TPA: hypothetical protein DCP35_02000 [Butyricimonas sp.]|nr:hypothetical protein [Butyricimonas sp.]